jgi:hypothetical protein
MKHAVSSAAAPAAIGPYSQAVDAGPFVFVSGQLPVDPATGAIPDGAAAPRTAARAASNLSRLRILYRNDSISGVGCTKWTRMQKQRVRGSSSASPASNARTAWKR